MYHMEEEVSGSTSQPLEEVALRASQCHYLDIDPRDKEVVDMDDLLRVHDSVLGQYK